MPRYWGLLYHAPPQKNMGQFLPKYIIKVARDIVSFLRGASLKIIVGCTTRGKCRDK